jgi:flagellar motility protein MotE (MotC chaperone)
MAKKKESVQTETKNNNFLTILIALVIVIIWLAIFGIFVKLDIGGFGSGVLRPILKDVPIINMILPNIMDDQIVGDNEYGYSTLPEAIAMIKELEANNAKLLQENEENKELIAELQQENSRLKVFEERQEEFEKRQKEFDEKVVFADKAPDIDEYRKFYEQINPANAEAIYRQVTEQLKFSNAITEYANIYKNMKPDEAAKILETMTADIEAVAQILLSMKPKESAKILAEMNNVVAAKITKKMLDMDEERLGS